MNTAGYGEAVVEGLELNRHDRAAARALMDDLRVVYADAYAVEAGEEKTAADFQRLSRLHFERLRWPHLGFWIYAGVVMCV